MRSSIDSRDNSDSRSSSRSDLIAQAAARLFIRGEVETVTDAVKLAAVQLDWLDVVLPSKGLVRKHIQAMEMQALGVDGYKRKIVSIWEQAEQIMTLLEDDNPMLVGRAVKGYIDGGVTLYIRLYTRRQISDIVQILVDMGYAEPGFDTADTKFGRFDRIVFKDEGVPVVITRCDPNKRVQLKGVNLFSKEPVPALDLYKLRSTIDNYFDNINSE